NISTTQNIQPFLLLSKSVKGAANAKLIMDTLEAPGVYVFSELYESPNLIEASSLPEVKPYYALLELFLYGTYQEYIANAAQLPSLTPTQLVKLKHLTIVTLSENSRTLAYDDLLRSLDIATVRELEDLIIDAIYQGVLSGKLDQRKQQVQVDTAMGRDLRPGQLDDMIERMVTWTQQTHTMMQVMEDKIQDVLKQVNDNDTARNQYEQAVADIRKDVHSKNKQTMLELDSTS
ncbi:uncharacterized protein BX664DRAFT_239425, partial [Halteromyces radiatus]|uniref:uncharacterized protein n=1 Tax=Halteromyces radiatus TaxID=101107 RepID=UPI002220C7E9